MRTLGILGGMSWESTLVYYRLINQGVAARQGGLHSAPLRIASVNFAEVAALQRQGNWQAAGKLLGQCASQLSRAGAQGLLIATNTMHKVAEAIQADCDLPLLHIADATASALHRDRRHRIGVLGTLFTMEDGFLLDRYAHQHGLCCEVPDALERQAVHRIIFEELCQGQILESSRQTLAQMIDHLARRGCDAVVLGCTELSLLLPPSDAWPIPLYDTTALHAQAAVDWILENGA